MMEKTIRMLKDKGHFDFIVSAVRKGMKKNVLSGLMKTIVLEADEELQNQWVDDIHKLGVDALWDTIQQTLQEQEAVEALNDVDPDALFEKATGHRLDQEDFEDKTCCLDDVVDKLIMSVCKKVIDDFEEKEGC